MSIQVKSMTVALPRIHGGERLHISQVQDRAMPRRRLDEYDVDFSDTRPFMVSRWSDICIASKELLPETSQEAATKIKTWDDFAAEVESKLSDPSCPVIMKREIRKILPLPRVLAVLALSFADSVLPYEVDFEIVWGLIYLNLKMSYTSIQRLRRVADIFNRICRLVELFNGCLGVCHNVNVNEAMIATVDFLDPLLAILTDLFEYLNELSDQNAERMWPEIKERITAQLKALDLTVKHVNDLTSYSQANRELEVKNLTMRHALMPESEEKGAFPVQILPFRQNQKFYGRKEDLDKILEYLSPKDDHSFRTYTIYGRRGVGKTAVALQFAYTNTTTYDAIFWIQCETSVTIRQSFTNVAVALNIPAADRDGRHEENLIGVQNWLKKTSKKWLLIFDNVENERILRSYWPVGVSGAVLITSRLYHNFIRDVCRQGATVKPFNDKQSWELLLELLGPEWKRLEQDRKIETSELAAAKSMLKDLEGLALAILQTSILIKDTKIGGPNIAMTYEIFKERRRTLPKRQSTPRSSSEESLDALWDIIFRSLTPSARVLIGVLAWLSPDAIPIKVFLPREQSALDGRLSFCKQDAVHIDPNNRASLVSIISPSPEFERAVQELLERELVGQDNQLLSIHRVVQEAVNYYDVKDLQSSFEAASRLIFQQFPKRTMDEDLYSEWNKCQDYISHVIHLSKKYSEFTKHGILKGTPDFIKVLSNAAWYLYEVGDYDACNRVVENGIDACEAKPTRLYAGLRSTEGCLFYELNRLGDCRIAWEEAQKVRRLLLPHDHPGIAAMYNNLGNLELATGDVEKAMENYQNALQIWLHGGDSTAMYLATTYLCLGRMYMLQGKFDEALTHTIYSDELVGRTIGTDKGFMAFVHYAYGNIHNRQGQFDLAFRSYDACRNIALANMPMHPITAAAWYSLACVELSRGNLKPALFDLDKAKVICRLRSPAREDGPIARILWKRATVLEADPKKEEFKEEVARLKRQALSIQQTLTTNGEGGTIPYIDQENRDRDREEGSFDALVPLFYR